MTVTRGPVNGGVFLHRPFPAYQKRRDCQTIVVVMFENGSEKKEPPPKRGLSPCRMRRSYATFVTFAA